MTPPTALFEDVSDTARWVAYCRALESERPDALFRDSFARRLAGERGRTIAEAMPAVSGGSPGPSGLAAILAVRTAVFDEMILDSIKTIAADAVLNLASGLDVRPYRLPLPASLVWIEADHAQILAAKQSLLASEKPVCRVERVPTDLANERARRDLLDQITASHTRVVVITEGLLAYLEETVVRTLAGELRERPAIQRWILEAISPEVLRRNMHAWGPMLAPAKAEWKFAQDNGLDFYRPLGWLPFVRRPFFPEARRLRRDAELGFAPLVQVLPSLSAELRIDLENSVVYGTMKPSSA